MPAPDAEDVYIGQRKDHQPQREPRRRTGFCKMRAALRHHDHVALGRCRDSYRIQQPDTVHGIDQLQRKNDPVKHGRGERRAQQHYQGWRNE